jgi:hypothetical protein
MDDLSTATKPKEYIVKLDSRSADAFGQVGVVVDNAGIPRVAPTAWHNDRAAAMLAFVVELFALSPAHRSATGDLVGFPLGHLAFGQCRAMTPPSAEEPSLESCKCPQAKPYEMLALGGGAGCKLLAWHMAKLGHGTFIAPKTTDVSLNDVGMRLMNGEPAILTGSSVRINLAVRGVRKPETARLTARCVSTCCRSNHGQGGNATIAAVLVLPS